VIVKANTVSFSGGRIIARAIVPCRDLLNIWDLNAETRLILREYIPGERLDLDVQRVLAHQSQCLFSATRKTRQFPSHRGSTCLGSAPEMTPWQRDGHLMQAVRLSRAVNVGYRLMLTMVNTSYWT
jgi:hypothetical protein